MSSKVYFTDFRASPKENLVDKIGRLVETAGLANVFNARDLVAVKMHFGEKGNTAFINPLFIKQVIKKIKEFKGIPFLTDANTLYAGARCNSPIHLKTAIENGFSYSVMDNTPIIIADGLRGHSETAININQKHCKEVYIGSEIVNADSLISIAHFKGHELSGFGGTIKNLGMGCASRRGKLDQHSTVSPKVTRKQCVACGDCIKHCPGGAISIIDKKAKIDSEKCIGCGECIIICPNKAIQIQWNQSVPVFLEKMSEYTLGVLQNKKESSFFINFITNVSPACDCLSYNDAPIVRDIGILASNDPVAIDQASVDLVNNEHALPGTCLTQNREPGEDKFRGIYPRVDWSIQLSYGQEIGLGKREYELISIDENKKK